MNRDLLLGCALAVSFCTAETAFSHPPPPSNDPAVKVRAVFADKCASCHGADVAKPKGKFGYVLDLERVAGNPKLVVPFKPEESKLWKLVSADEMPPDWTTTRSLSEEEKQVIYDWIAGGAPSPRGTTAHDGSPDSDHSHPQQADSSTASPPLTRILHLAGNFHILLLHFPIALFVAAAAGDLWSLGRGSQVPSPTVRFCVLLGTAATIPTVLLGWLHAAAGSGVDSPGLLALHRWIGTAAGAVAVAVAVCFEIDAHRGTRGWPGRVVLFVGVALIGVAAHFGGLLVHGEDFFDF